MSAFNILSAECACPVCKKTGLFSIQFKYGDTWQYHYQIGDILRWGGNDVGIRDTKSVRIEAIGGPCLYCGTDNIEFDLLLEENKIKNVFPLGLERPSYTIDGFEVIEP